MLETVKYQLDRAEEALRAALQIGASKEDPYLLKNIAEAVNAVKGWSVNYKYNVTKETFDQGIKFNLTTTDYGLDEQPYYVNSRVKGGMGEDVITFN